MFWSLWSPDHKTWEGESCTNNDIVKVETVRQRERRPALSFSHHPLLLTCCDWSVKSGSTAHACVMPTIIFSVSHLVVFSLCMHLQICTCLSPFASVFLVPAAQPFFVHLFSYLSYSFFPYFVFASEVFEFLRALLILF